MTDYSSPVLLDVTADGNQVERWLPVVGYEGLYEVSDHGHVRGVRFGPKTLSLVKSGGGYLRLGLRDRDGKRRDWKVHRLVLIAFVGPPPEGHEACHRDCDKTNNNLANLRWDTPAANRMDSVIAGNSVVPLEECRRGHPLKEWNLKRRPTRPQVRMCLACHRARKTAESAKRRGRDLDVAALADLRFKELVTTYS